MAILRPTQTTIDTTPNLWAGAIGRTIACAISVWAGMKWGWSYFWIAAGWEALVLLAVFSIRAWMAER